MFNFFYRFQSFLPAEIVYDIEVYPNIFTFAAIHSVTNERWLFEISDRRNDLMRFSYFIAAANGAGCEFVGFNNIGYDYPVCHYILSHGINDPALIYKKSMSIIETPWENRFAHTIWENDWLFRQIDLLKVHHFDNKARSTGLKKLEFNMRMSNIEDLPFPVGTYLNDSQKEVLIEYNFYDCEATLLFLKKSKSMIDFRRVLSERYGKDYINFNDTKIGKQYFIDRIEQAHPGTCYKKIDGKKVKVQTQRGTIHINSIIFDYIKFENSIFKMVLDWLKNFSINKTKGVFEYIEVSPSFAFNMNPERIRVHGLTEADLPLMLAKEKWTKKKQHTVNRMLSNGLSLVHCKDDLVTRTSFDNIKFISGWKDNSGLNCIINDFQFVFGTGGIHGSISNKKVHSSTTHQIIDIDVKSFYPSIAITNTIYPAHLGELFCIIYKDLFNERDDARQQGLSDIVAMLKLALNGVFGDTNQQHSVFYDSQYTMAVTINGQLLLCMLAEALIKSKDVQLIQVNTDGITVKIHNNLVDWMKQVCNWWESFTGLVLEYAEYKSMFIRDVNNYIAVYDDDEKPPKRKGAYEYELDWHKDHSNLVVPKAAEAFLLSGTNDTSFIDEFIYSHTDIYDFMLLVKVPRNSFLEFDGAQVSNTIRYYISEYGGKLEKVMPPTGEIGTFKRKNSLSDEYYNAISEEACGNWDARIHTANKSKYATTRTEIQSGWKVKLCNNMSGVDVFADINYEWYIKETQKLVCQLTE